MKGTTAMKKLLTLTLTATLLLASLTSCRMPEKKDPFKEILEENIKQTAEDLLTDSIITQSFGLDWYSKIETYTDTEINVNII